MGNNPMTQMLEFGSRTAPDDQSDVSRLSSLLTVLACPRCHSTLKRIEEGVQCTACHETYPTVDGIPILICDDRSVFQASDFATRAATFFAQESRMRRLVFALVPDLSANRTAERNYETLATLLLRSTPRPRILVVGGSIVGAGMAALRRRSEFEFIDTDVSFGPMTQVICDAHDLPVPDSSVDAVILQAVLEHVVNPYRCVEEVVRVLKPRGLVYAETPFLEPAHSTPYDFQRFTFVGYRRLFRQFEQIGFGVAGGPAQVLAHQYENTLFCIGRSRAAHAVALIVARWTGFWLKYLDPWLSRNPHAFHCAFGYFFLGVRSERALDDREVLEACRSLC